jgi:hypothetical protein
MITGADREQKGKGGILNPFKKGRKEAVHFHDLIHSSWEGDAVAVVG